MTAPSAPPSSYKEALAAVAASRAARTAPSPTRVTSVLAENTIAVRERIAATARNAIRGLWAGTNPYSDSAVADFAAKAAKLMRPAQIAAGRAAAVNLTRQLKSVGVNVQTTPSYPLDIRAASADISDGRVELKRHAVTVDYADDTAHLTAKEMTTEAVFRRPAVTFRYLESEGGDDPAQQASLRIDTIVDDNLMLAQRLAQQEVLAATVDLDRPGAKIIGYRRVIHPELSRSGTCGLCIAASDRIYHVAELMPIHTRCVCTIAAVTEDHDPADELNTVDLSQLYQHAGGTSAAHLKRTRYQVDEHGELGAVLVPKKSYRPRDAKKRAVAENNARAVTVPEARADIARRQLPALQKSLADLRGRGLAEDSPQITYHIQQIAKFKAAITSQT